MATYHGYVIVGIDSDERITKAYPYLPIIPQEVRLANLRVLKVNNVPLVDSIHIFNTDDELLDLVKSVTADIMVKGSEWRGKEIIGSEFVKEVKFYDAEMNGISDKISSSSIIEMIISKHAKQSVEKVAPSRRKARSGSSSTTRKRPKRKQ